ncbi:endonuclease I [Bacillus clarus]|uniref:Endonuclease I n=1 Tax=Bacillus clarus TaxID=2338372 RepID=A0A090Z156_9BACI|nr:endonuclease [Bacillus clarus]KFN04063.1 endonuclease I family protein [Bacillus clarus]RFT66364.1 endonuclease I [Bacillus clarus]
MTQNQSNIPEDEFSTLLMSKSEQIEILNQLSKNKENIEKDTKEYFDEEAEKLTLDTYYKTINFEQLNPQELFKVLQHLLENTHNPVKYNPARFLYNWVDLQSNGKLKSIYSGKIRNPEEVITEDFNIITKRKNELDTLVANESFKKDELENHKKRIEHNNKLNCEHVVPQSWFNKQEPMRGDLHHLFACDPPCNSMRSNYPYHDFLDYEGENEIKGIRQECGKEERHLFEPEYAKGIVARATLYFLLRYPNKITNDREIEINIELLLKWHEKYPVSIYEKHRNQSIQEIQGNRNPLIDFPIHARKIDFSVISS